MNKIHRAEWFNAIERNKQNPDTFFIPDKEARQSIKEGDLVKIGHNQERFWVKITCPPALVAEGGNKINYCGEVANLLVNEHEFNVGDYVAFTEDNVLDIMEMEP